MPKHSNGTYVLFFSHRYGVDVSIHETRESCVKAADKIVSNCRDDDHYDYRGGDEIPEFSAWGGPYAESRALDRLCGVECREVLHEWMDCGDEIGGYESVIEMRVQTIH